MGSCSLNICRTEQKLLKWRLDRQRMVFLIHKKKTSIIMIKTMTMRKNEKYGKMVRRCTCRFH
jgi:hypothetical protein